MRENLTRWIEELTFPSLPLADSLVRLEWPHVTRTIARGRVIFLYPFGFCFPIAFAEDGAQARDFHAEIGGTEPDEMGFESLISPSLPSRLATPLAPIGDYFPQLRDEKKRPAC